MVERSDERADGVLHRLAAKFADLGEQVKASEEHLIYQTIAQLAARYVDGAREASITVYRNSQFSTVAATGERARVADALQYELGSGPCVDAILTHSLYRPADLRHDEQWPIFGARASKELGWLSMLSYRMSTEITDEGVLAGLNIYSDQPGGFRGPAVEVGMLLATHGAMVVAAQTNRERADNLRCALEASREIGIAQGMLMYRYTLTREQAFDLLRIASQNSNRKLKEIAHEVADTGAMPYQTFLHDQESPPGPTPPTP